MACSLESEHAYRPFRVSCEILWRVLQKALHWQVKSLYQWPFHQDFLLPHLNALFLSQVCRTPLNINSITVRLSTGSQMASSAQFCLVSHLPGIYFFQSIISLICQGSRNHIFSCQPWHSHLSPLWYFSFLLVNNWYDTFATWHRKNTIFTVFDKFFFWIHFFYPNNTATSSALRIWRQSSNLSVVYYTCVQ